MNFKSNKETFPIFPLHYTWPRVESDQSTLILFVRWIHCINNALILDFIRVILCSREKGDNVICDDDYKV